MNPDASLLLVAYRSGSDLGPAVQSFRRESERAGVVPEVVIVEQSEDEAEREAAMEAEPDRLVVQGNLGYAAGINRGIREATGELLLAGNPDIRFHPGSVEALVGALEDDWGIVGPRFRRGAFLFPPSEIPRPMRTIVEGLSGRSPRTRRWWLRRELRRYSRVWEAEATVAQEQLSGALLAFRPEVVRAVGPWDEAFFLYFEESDWLTRARRAGVSVGLVPSAVVEHRWGGSGGDTGNGELFQRSRRRYMLRHHGWLGRLALRWSREPVDVAGLLSDRRGGNDRDDSAWWWLASPFPSGLPAARLDPGSDRPPTEAARELVGLLGRGSRLRLWAWDPERAGVEEAHWV